MNPEGLVGSGMSQKDKHCDSTPVRASDHSQRQAAEGWLQGAEGEREMEGECLMGTEFHFCKVTRILEMEGGPSDTAAWACSMLLTCTPPGGGDGVRSVTCILHH